MVEINGTQLYPQMVQPWRWTYQVEDGVESVQLTVEHHVVVLLVLQVLQQLDEGRLRQRVQVHRGHLPAALRRSVQDPLEDGQTWEADGQTDGCKKACSTTETEKERRIDGQEAYGQTARQTKRDK